MQYIGMRVYFIMFIFIILILICIFITLGSSNLYGLNYQPGFQVYGNLLQT